MFTRTFTIFFPLVSRKEAAYRCSNFGWALLLSLSLLSLPSLSYAQAWTLPKGASYTKFFYGEVTAAQQYTFDGRATDFIDGLAGDTYRDRSLYMYSEIGLSDRFSLVLSLPYKRSFVRDHAFRFRVFGLGTASVGGRFSLQQLFSMNPSRNALAANVMVHVPTGYTRNYAPSTGAGQVDVQASIFYGRSFHPFPAYAQVGAGYRHKSSLYLLSKAAPCRGGSDIHCIVDARPDYGDELLFHAEAGISPPGGMLLLQAIVTSAWSLEKPVVGFSALNPIPTHQRVAKVGAGITVYPFHVLKSPLFASIGVSAQYFETPFGQNTINSRDLFVGVELRPQFF